MAESSQNFVTRFLGNDRSLQSAFARSRRGFRDFGRFAASAGRGVAIVGAAGLAAGAGILYLGNKAQESIDKLNKMSERLDTSVGNMQALREASELAGSDFDTVTKSMEKFERVLGDALRGKSGALAAFEDLGFDVEKVAALASEDLPSAFEKVGQALVRMDKDQKAASAGAELFGRSYKVLTNLFSTGGISRAIQEYKDLGLTLRDEAADGVSDTEDAWTKLENRLQNFSELLTANLSPAFGAMTTGLREQLDALAKSYGGYDKLAELLSGKVLDALDSFGKSLDGTWATIDRGIEQAD
ncbi:MAG: hypothetical protein ACPGVG_18410 [Mycobacterium sp.]